MLKTTMFGSNRRPFALTVPGIAILILLAGLLWVGSGYKPVSADPLIPPNQVVYTPTFSTANQSKWGPGINGVVEAADYYFGKHPAELSLGESVWLSSIVPAPRRRGRQRSQGEPADWSMRHCGQIMEGMANRDWITARELTRGLEAPVRFVTSPRYGLPDAPTGPPGMLGLEPVPANGQLAIVRADVEPERDVTAPLLRLAPEARIRALIASSISLRPGSAE